MNYALDRMQKETDIKPKFLCNYVDVTLIITNKSDADKLFE